MPKVEPQVLSESSEPVRAPALVRRLSPAVIVLLVIGGVGLMAACAVTVIAAGMIVVMR